MKNKYCLGEFFSNCYAFALTKLLYRGARFIGRPLYLRGRKSMSMGKGLTIGHACRFDLDGKKKTLFIGDNCDFGDNTHIVAFESVTIGDNVLCASNVFISDTDHGCYSGSEIEHSHPLSKPKDRPFLTKPVKIGSNVWLGENVVVLRGVTIGDGCVVGANCVVTKSFDAFQVIVGNPARAIKRFNFETNKWEDLSNENTSD